MNGMFVKFLDEIKEPKVSELGGKGYSLAVLFNNGFNVPRGFVIISEAFFEYLRKNNMMEKVRKLSLEIDENNFREKSREIRNLILSGKIQENIESEVKETLSKLNANYVSVRSSAVSEDSLKVSFAGLHDTFLNVKAETSSVLENVKKCWASLFNDRAVIYRIKKKIPHLEGMAVIIQEMIPAEISGVVFTVHPMREKYLLIEASYGIGDMVMSGKVEPDGYVVNRETLEIVGKKIGRKNIMTAVEDEKTIVINVKRELVRGQALPDEKIKEIAQISLKVEKILNYPQDIEWCIKGDKLWLLQSRAITSI
jgi:phosphoenolpyruvate synthase/pyruvate phosphate dikinase